MQKLDLNIKSEFIKDNVLNVDFGGYGKHSKVSFPIKWDKVSAAKSYALYMIDYDATHVVGFPFIHWLVANIKNNELVYDATHLDKTIIQGQNSCTNIQWLNTRNHKPSIEEILENANYTGPTPPDKDHIYTIYIFALDKEDIKLQPGFFLDEFYHKILQHIIGFDFINVKYHK